MLESIITISIAGILAGFIFSMPIGGPISIIITSNALKGRLRYCILISTGAFIADFAYVFIAVFGLAKLYSFYKPAIPYIFGIGALFFLYLGFRIIRAKINIENPEEKILTDPQVRNKDKGAFLTGFLINFLNPTLFIGVLTSSFFVITLIASLGLHTGGLAGTIDKSVREINIIDSSTTIQPEILPIEQFNNFPKLGNGNHKPDQTIYPVYFHIIISFCYAFFISFGGIIWLYLLSFMIVRFRQRINIKLISALIKGLGLILCIFGLFFGYLSARMLFSIL